MLSPQYFAMNILDIFEQYGFEPKRKTENEYSAPCPECGGKDRCILWPNHTKGTGGRFYCRQCGLNGDVIDFLQKFEGMSYEDACVKAGKTKDSLAGRENLYNRVNQSISFSARLKERYFPPEKWIKAASVFLSNCQIKGALECNKAIDFIARDRFIPLVYARKIYIGWHTQDEYVERKAWGLPETDNKKKLLLPAGIVIATKRKIGIVNLTIRRIENDNLKYWQVAGGARDVPYIPQFTPNLPIFLLESALDAALLCHAAGNLCNAVALGGTNKEIDSDTMAFINTSPLIIASPDNDEAGNNAMKKWQKLFPSAWGYRAIGAKDIGEMHKIAMGINIQKVPNAREFAEHAIEFCRQKRL